MGEIRVGGDSYKIRANVVRGPEFEFRKLRRRPAAPRLGVLHWYRADSIGDAIDGLKMDSYSVDFLVDCAGTIVQCNPDPVEFYCQHARGVNQRAWGAEILNPTWPKVAGPGAAWRDTITMPQPHRRIKNARVKLIEVYEFTRPQIAAAVELCRVMTRILDMPVRLPRVGPGSGLEADRVEKAGEVSLGLDWWNEGTKRREPIRDTYTGICGHYHVTTRRLDPGSQLWASLVEAGY